MPCREERGAAAGAAAKGWAEGHGRAPQALPAPAAGPLRSGACQRHPDMAEVPPR